MRDRFGARTEKLTAPEIFSEARVERVEVCLLKIVIAKQFCRLQSKFLFQTRRHAGRNTAA